MSEIRHFLDLSHLDSSCLRSLLDDALRFKQSSSLGSPLQGRVLAMLFDKPSTRTRVSFDVGMRRLGGTTLFLDGEGSQMGRGESIADTARVLSRYVDIIMMRTGAHDDLLEMSHYAEVPVINALTDSTHPCQILADIMTFEEHKGSIAGKTLSWTGDGNNVLHSFIEASVHFDFRLQIATPESRPPNSKFVDWAKSKGADISLSHDINEAVEGSDCVMTDKWLSMGMDVSDGGHNIFAPYQVNSDVMSRANSDAIFMHCLPAKRGEEVTADVIDGPQSVVFDEAENRLHTQMAILHWCLKG